MMRNIILAALAAVVSALPAAVRAAVPTDAELYAQWSLKEPDKWSSPGRWDCMDVAWSGMNYAFGAMYAYAYSGDIGWLETAGTGLDIMKQGVRTDPRGEPAFITDSDQFFTAGNGLLGVPVGGESFKMLQGFAMYAAFALNEPSAPRAVRERGEAYLRFVRDTMMVKWDRDWWYQSESFPLIHPNAGVYRYPTYPEFEPNPSRKCQTSQYNKQHDAGRINLYLWKATGDSIYWHKARRILVNYISKCRLKGAAGTYYEWDYGNPAGPYDGGCEDKSWIEHKGGYMRLTTDFVVECYEAGIAVDSKEISRFVTTMMTKIWNGSMTDPKYALNDGSSMGSGGALTAFVGFNDTLAAIVKQGLAGQTEFHQSEGIPRTLYFKKIIEDGHYLPDADIRDYIPPKHISCTALNKGKVRIVFDEPMDPVSCLNTANWSISRDLPVLGVVLSADHTEVTLYTGEQKEGVNYKVTVDAADAAGNGYFNHAFQVVRFDAGTLPLDHDGLGVAGDRSTGPVPAVTLTVQPNPVQGSTVICASGPVEILDMAGRVMFRAVSAGHGNEQRLVWDGRDTAGKMVSSGTYYVRAGAAVQRIMVID